MILSVVIPCYNEEAVLQETYNVLSAKMQQLIESKSFSPKSFLFLKNDGRKNKTWTIFKNLTKKKMDNSPPPPMLIYSKH